MSSHRPTPNLSQNINYTGSETEFSTEIKGDNVIVHCVDGIHNHGSSKVKLTDRIDYNWEFRYYHGHLVAAHISGKIIAYGMKGKDGGMVRVTNQETNKRALIKNLKEDIKDVSFAYSREEIILGCVDSEGNILVYQIEETPLDIKYTLLLHIYHLESNRSAKNYRLIWCPFLPSFDEEVDSTDDPEKMFVVLNGKKAQVYNVPMLVDKYGKGNTLDPDDSYEGFIEINHTADVIDAAFSSDGTAIAIASVDGYVKFFQLYMFDNEKQKCLHEWRPHDGDPLSSIIFIDNVLEYSSECWKFTITGANNNSEIKLWSCESWTCLQTIRFKADPSSPITSIYLNIAIDYTGKFLVISDINSRVIYVLQLSRNDKEQIVYVTTLARFLLPAPFLSYHILEAATKDIPFSYNNSNEDLYDDRDDFDEESEITAVCLKMLVIQPKKFQECNITFQPEALFYDTINNSPLKEHSIETIEEKDKVPKLDDLQESVALLIEQQSNNTNLTLMTPEDFTPPGRSSRPTSVTVSANKSVEEINNEVADLIDFQRPQKDNFASGGSSPSREVQEILSLNNSNYSTQDYFDNLTKIQDEQEEPQKEYSNQTDTMVYQDGDMGWPKIPDVPENDIIKDENFRKELRLSEEQNLSYRMSTLETIVREQNILLQKLHQDRLDKEKLVEDIECALSKQYLQINKKLDSFMNMQKSKEKELHEQIVKGVTQVLTKALAEKLQQIISQEMKHIILPAVHNLIESYRTQVETQYSQKMTNMDVMLKDNVAKAFNNKALADSLSLSVVNIVAPSLEKCYRDIISSSLIPSWERVCGQMFQQINETFTRGTKEYTASVENYMDKQRRVQEKGKDLVGQMQVVLDKIINISEQLTNNLMTDIHKHFNTVFVTMQEKLTDNIKTVVSEQVHDGFKKNMSLMEDSVLNAVRSRAVTPSPHDNHLTKVNVIQQYLYQKNYEAAFQHALSAENLTYVIYACDKVDPQAVFGGEQCKISQSCLLSLIQQLSLELHNKTELKLKYIQAGFLSLQTDDPQTKQYIPKLLKDLQKQLTAFIATNPPTQHLTDARLLKMVVDSMLPK